MAGPAAAQDRLARLANIFVVVALVVMLVGAVLIISARETFTVDLDAGEEDTLVIYSPPETEWFGARLQVRVLSLGNFTVGPAPEGVADEVVIRIEETTSGAVVAEEGNGTIRLGGVIWETDAQPGERWVVQVTNLGEGPARVSATVESFTAYGAGGILVGIGILGFVAYRVGMRHANA